MRIHNQIARDAKAALGRPMHRRCNTDWNAWDAVVVAAARAGLDQPLLGYVDVDAHSLTAAARAYVARYAQAYGPVDDVIDVSQWIGSRRPVPVTMSSR